MTEKAKKSNGGKKFILGAVLGGVVGAVAGKFIKTNEKEIKSSVSKKVDEIKDKIGRTCKNKEKTTKKAKK